MHLYSRWYGRRKEGGDCILFMDEIRLSCVSLRLDGIYTCTSYIVAENLKRQYMAEYMSRCMIVN